MISSLSRRQLVRKPAVVSGAGIVATHNRIASETGARVLAEGGHAVDAAIAASFALGVVEPWMSGIGGVGAMLVHTHGGPVRGFDAGAVSPAALDPGDYRVMAGTDSDLFGWPQVEGNRNVVGPMSVAVPSLLRGLALAHAAFGRLPWARLVEPAIALARDGVPVEWPVTLKVSTAFSDLARDPAARAVFLPGGAPPVPPITAGGPGPRLTNPALADTLSRIAREGAGALYAGPVAEALVADLAAGGASLSLDDLRHARAVEATPAAMPLAGHLLHHLPDLNGGPTAARALATLTDHGHAGRYDPAMPGPVVAIAAGLRDAWKERFATMGDSPANTSTTHINVVDRNGNLVALTQTLLSLFGARWMSPSTGILMNNGINWFDPRGGPNALRPGKRALANYCPVILTGDNDAIGIGGAGGRKILPAVAQLAAMVTSGMTIEGAIHHPRIDVSGTEVVTADARLPEAVRAALARRFTVAEAEPAVYPYPFTIASLVRRLGGESQGATDPVQPTTEAVGEDDV